MNNEHNSNENDFEEGSGGVAKKCLNIETPEVIGGTSSSSLSSTATTFVLSIVGVVSVAVVAALAS